MIRLHKDAPWNEVDIRGVKINKTDWIDDSTYHDPVKKWIIHEDAPVEQTSITNELSVVLTDYSKLAKTELIKICEEKNIDSKGLTKAQLIEKLTNI